MTVEIFGHGALGHIRNDNLGQKRVKGIVDLDGDDFAFNGRSQALSR